MPRLATDKNKQNDFAFTPFSISYFFKLYILLCFFSPFFIRVVTNVVVVVVGWIKLIVNKNEIQV